MSDLQNQADASHALHDPATVRDLHKLDTPRAAALFLSAFFDELARCGVREVVVSPGSRSTPLSMVAFEASKRTTCAMKLYLDVDERGAAFFALGLAKASGNPVCLICTSGTAVANYYPAVLEAEASRVPLILLTGDRPPRLQNLGAPQTCDQIKAYGDHVRFFQQMPLPGSHAQEIAFARQMAKTACIRALGPGAAGPVHLNFPFEEPLKPDLSMPDLFEMGRGSGLRRADAVDAEAEVEAEAEALPVLIDAAAQLSEDTVRSLASIIHDRRTLVLVGEHTLLTPPTQVVQTEDTLAVSDGRKDERKDEREELVRWARRFGLPLLADPLSGVRACEDMSVIDAYDAIFASASNILSTSNASNAFASNASNMSSSDISSSADSNTSKASASEYPPLSCVIRFGRYPVSKRCAQAIAAQQPFQIVVDPVDTQDFNSATDLFVRCNPMDFVRALAAYADKMEMQPHEAQLVYRDAWIASNAAARRRCAAALQVAATTSEASEKSATEKIATDAAAPYADATDAAALSAATFPLEAATVASVIKLIPDHSCVFAANSMAVRLVDAVYQASSKQLSVLCNRGLNGIDGTLSSALGAAQHFAHTTLITGDLALLHDINALALQRELLQHHGSNIVIVLLNNNGGGIFDMLPQRSEEEYFERLFMTPQDVDFAHAAAAFHVSYHLADSPEAFADAYQAALSRAGVSIVEVRVPIAGLKERMRRLL